MAGPNTFSRASSCPHTTTTTTTHNTHVCVRQVCRAFRTGPQSPLSDLVGCTAELRQMRREGDGSVYVVAKGRQRMLRLHQGEPATEPWETWVSWCETGGGNGQCVLRISVDWGVAESMPGYLLSLRLL